jgi:periplasmic protein TonB
VALQLNPYYRSFDLAWDKDPEDQRRFRGLLLIGLAVVLVVGLVLPLIQLPSRTRNLQEVPPQLAKLMKEEQPKPPPPKPVEQPKPEKPKTEPVPTPKPVDTRKKMENTSAMKAIKDELADLRDQVDTNSLRNKDLTKDVSADARSERSLISSKVGTGSAGIVSANTSRGFGSGSGALSDHTAGSVSSRLASDVGANRATRTGTSNKAARSQEEIELVFDKNKGAIYALYTRALRERADLQGKLVLQLTISPAGDVTDCRVLSSELNDPELENKIVARVKLFKFEAKDVEAITARKTIEFFPQ